MGEIETESRGDDHEHTFRISPRITYPLVGLALGVGAPAGALLVRALYVETVRTAPMADLRANAFFYAYSLVGSSLVFAVAGALAGARVHRLRNAEAYYHDSFLLNGRFLARFRDSDTVLVLQLATIDNRDVLMEMDPEAFFFTEHYRNYPAVLIRLAAVPSALFADVLRESWKYVVALPPKRPRVRTPR